MASNANTYAYTCPTGGSFPFIAKADSTNIEAEYNENNNINAAYLFCRTPGADLVVEGRFTTTSKVYNFKTGVTEYFGQISVTTKNVGNVAAGPSQTLFGSEIINVPGIASGASSVYTRAASCTIGYRIALKADAGNAVNEGDETNNEAKLGMCDQSAIAEQNTNPAGSGYNIQIGDTSVGPMGIIVAIAIIAVGAWFLYSKNQKKPSKRR
jgi:subtilase family serine protease